MNGLPRTRGFSKLLGIAVFPCPVGQFLGFGGIQGAMSEPRVEETNYTLLVACLFS